NRSGKLKGGRNRTTRFRLLDGALSIMCSAPRSNINKNITEMRLKSRNFNRYTPKVATYYSANPIIQSAQPFSAFSRTDEQYFVDAVSIRPVILSKIPWPQASIVSVNAGSRDFRDFFCCNI